jgi:hypothetical protein
MNGPKRRRLTIANSLLKKWLLLEPEENVPLNHIDVSFLASGPSQLAGPG